MTIVLARRPPSIEAFFFSVTQEHEIEAAVDAIQEVLATTSGVTGSINLMNARRVLSMLAPYPSPKELGDGIISPKTLATLMHQHKVTPWTGVGALYGEKTLVKAARSIIRNKLQYRTKRLVFLHSGLVTRANRLISYFPQLHSFQISKTLKSLEATLNIIEGQPSKIALPLAYWKSSRPPTQEMNPAQDGCGLLWYSPLVPMHSDQVRYFVEMVTEICHKHSMEPLITLTSLSDRCFNSTIPLLFNRNNPAEEERAEACYLALFEAGCKKGFIPYRMGIQHMQRVTGVQNPFWTMTSKLKAAIDPNQIIAPGRYSPRP